VWYRWVAEGSEDGSTDDAECASNNSSSKAHGQAALMVDSAIDVGEVGAVTH
jgi:hypothetical protein